MLGFEDEDVEEDHEHETEAPVHPEPVVKAAPEIPKEPERQLSKKERKKKELEELDALLADMGVHNANGEGIYCPRFLFRLIHYNFLLF